MGMPRIRNAAGDLLFGFRIELTKAEIWFERLRRRLELGAPSSCMARTTRPRNRPSKGSSAFA